MRFAIGLALLALVAVLAAQAAPSAPGQVIVRPDPPLVTTIAPNSGLVGSSVVITGRSFGPAQENSTVTFNGAPAVTIAWSDTSITALVPPAGTTGPVLVTRGGVASVGQPFTVIPSPAPVIGSLSPTSGQVGTPVTVAGSNFGATQGTSVLTFNGIVATATSWNTSTIITNVPVGATTGPVHVVVLGQTSNNQPFTVLVPPVLTSLNLNTGPVGTVVTLTGTNFGATQGSSLVTFNGVAAAPSSWAATSITAAVPTGATTGPVQVTVGGLTSNSLTFTVTTGGTIPCDQSTVEAAMAAIYPGTGTVRVGPGNCQWSWMWIYEGITLQGSVGGTTTITPSSGIVVAQMSYLPQEPRLTGFTFTCAQVFGNGGASNFRIDHNVFTCPGSFPVNVGILVQSTSAVAGVIPQGLIDHNTISDVNIQLYGYPASGAGWEQYWNAQAPQGTTPLNFGTEKAVYVEDNTFIRPYVNGIDCQHLGAYVFRHNYMDGGYFEAHSARDSSRGCKSWEVYENDLTSATTAPDWLWLLRGGTGVIFNNRWAGSFPSQAAAFDNVRSYNFISAGGCCYIDPPPHAMCGVSTYPGFAHGASPFDGNTDNSGYPCLDQIGRGPDTSPQVYPFPPYPVQASTPVYIWNNNKYTSSANAATNTNPTLINSIYINQSGPGQDCDPRCAQVIQQNRDFVLNAGAKPGYTPYIYPHPLQGIPTIVSLSTTSGPVGTGVTIAGVNFGAAQGSSVVRFNGTTATVPAWSATSLTTTVPAGATTGIVTVTVNGVQSNGVTFTVTGTAPTLTSLSVTTGPIGTTVTLTGTNFGATQTTSTVTFNGVTAAVSAWSATSITVTVPVGATTGQVRVTVGGVQSNGIQFTVT